MNYLCISNWARKSLLPAILITVHSTCFSQEIVVAGIVLNEQNQRVAGAELKLGASFARSGSKGTFTLRAAKLPAQLNVSHPSYSDYVEVVRSPLSRNDTLKIEIILEAKATALEEVTIRSSRIIRAYDKKNTHLLDFALYRDEILLVGKENHSYFLRRLDSIGQKIVDFPIKKNPVGLYNDCTGGIHLVYADSTFEIKLIRNSIGILSGHPLEETMRVLSPCIISSDHNFIVKRMGAHNKLVEYHKIDWNTKRPDLLYSTIDRKTMRELDEFALKNEIPTERYNKSFLMGNQPNKPTDKEQFQNAQFYKHVLQKPLYAPIFEINDSIYIFDHATDSAIVFMLSGQYVRSYPINYHYFENWKSELLIDEDKTKLYARYETDGLVTLRQINPSTGKVVSLSTLEKHIFPFHIQIRDDFAYYIYKHYLDSSIHYLYKQALK